MFRSRLTPVLAALATFGCSLALAFAPDAAPEDAERRRKLEELERSPERLAQLRRHVLAFQALPKERQDQLLKLDNDLHAQPAAAQTRLLDLLGRYDEWLENLDPKERQRIVEAPDRAGKLAVLHDIRDREWLRRQPSVVRDQYAKLDAKGQAELLKKLRAEEARTKREWVVASRFWSELQKGTPLPARLADFPTDVQTYVDETLKHFVTKEEWARLMATQGEWPRFPILLVKLADKYPPALPSERGPRRFNDLPVAVQKMFKAKGPPKAVKFAEGKPEFAKVMAHAAENRGGAAGLTFPNELWPYGYKGLSSEMKEFYDKKLWPVMTADEKKRMTDGPPSHWPDYPLALQDLAKAHHLRPPWFALPGGRERWDPYRFEKAEE